jgi:hypothetical protein
MHSIFVSLRIPIVKSNLLYDNLLSCWIIMAIINFPGFYIVDFITATNVWNRLY